MPLIKQGLILEEGGLMKDARSEKEYSDDCPCFFIFASFLPDMKQNTLATQKQTSSELNEWNQLECVL